MILATIVIVLLYALKSLKLVAMAFSSGHTLDSINQPSRHSCVYSGMNPYSVYRAALYGAYGEGLQTYAQNMLIQGQTDQFGACISSLYSKSCLSSDKSQEKDANSFSPVCMAAQPGRPQFNGYTTQALLPVVGMTSNFTGLLDASAPLKCTKQVHPLYWRKRGNSVPAEGMIRTKDKYRVVYTEKQKIGLEKEFKMNKFITTDKKAKLSKELELSERQIKIWFQNRRVKERRQRRKDETEKEEHGTSDDVQKQVKQLSETVCVDVLNNTIAETDFSSHNYPTLQYLEEPTPKSQCRFHDTGNSFYAEDISSAPIVHQSQNNRRFPTSPTGWSSTEAMLTTCNVSPFTANPDWNLVYRT